MDALASCCALVTLVVDEDEVDTWLLASPLVPALPEFAAASVDAAVVFSSFWSLDWSFRHTS